ncbi:MAG: hypothetical protein WDA16_05560 [Candidatus Thermoplasmatota archaeon]
MPLAPQVCYGAFSSLALSEDEETRNRARTMSIDQKQESRILAQAKDSWERLKRWTNEVNRKGEGRTYYNAEFVALAPQSRAGFLPQDRLQFDVGRHEQVFNPDPFGSQAKRDPGVVFYACSDFREAVANFDLNPFVEAYVRRLSQEVPEFVWRIGPHFYDRSIGLKFDPETRSFEVRRYPVPKQVVDAFGSITMLMVQKCAVCGKEDDKVIAQPSGKTPYAHKECYLGVPRAGPAAPSP